jgi:hypothetical protein
VAEAPLDLREVFVRPWEGDAELWQPWWLRWFPAPRRWTFRSEILNLGQDSWDVLDTSTFPNGVAQQRQMHCEVLASDRLKLTASDMPGGTEVQLRSDGFDFNPYVIRTPILGRLRLPFRHFDTVRLEEDGTMVDTIELRFLGVRVGRVRMRLRPA